MTGTNHSQSPWLNILNCPISKPSLLIQTATQWKGLARWGKIDLKSSHQLEGQKQKKVELERFKNPSLYVKLIADSCLSVQGLSGCKQTGIEEVKQETTKMTVNSEHCTCVGMESEGETCTINSQPSGCQSTLIIIQSWASCPNIFVNGNLSWRAILGRPKKIVCFRKIWPYQSRTGDWDIFLDFYGFFSH